MTSASHLLSEHHWNVPGDNTAQAKEEESDNVAANTEGLDEASEGENKDVQVEQDKDTGKEEEDVEMKKEKAAVRI
ncbi:hypothetical protein DUI87_09601 [Hirundo rustica rustica]|uniref:Uncharacterized protein n=1 Tax=Hirundo rustica rustica TaxID=333673 RepID=A0A3M0KN20_HIRRU|nr:hypothetical protein DUI87_09601 [Hirundo rustica rustica]